MDLAFSFTMQVLEVSTTDSPRKPSEGEEFVLCDYCQQPSKPFISREELENNPDLELVSAACFFQTIHLKQINASHNGSSKAFDLIFVERLE